MIVSSATFKGDPIEESQDDPQGEAQAGGPLTD